MLYSRWLETASRFHDLPAIIGWNGITTFGDLARQLATLKTSKAPIFARGSTREILLATLRGWRDEVPVIPLEKDAALPELPREFPPGIAHIKLTPGLEGSPRPVFFTASQMAADAYRLVAAMGMEPGTPNLAAVSLTHSYGFSSIVLPLVLHGIPILEVEVPFPRVVVEALAHHAAVIVSAVPSMWKAWHRSGILKDSPIVTAISAGAPLSLELEQAVYDSCGLKLHNFYGASECGGISYDSSTTPRTSADDLGQILPGVEVSLHASGRFLVHSDAVALGCHAAREGEILGDGLFLTQDSGRIDGRSLSLESSGADSINVAGRKIGPAKIEAALLSTGLVKKARAFGVTSHDRERVEEITALIELHGSATLEAVRLAATRLLAGWEMPRHWLEPATPEVWTLSRAELKIRFPVR